MHTLEKTEIKAPWDSASDEEQIAIDRFLAKMRGRDLLKHLSGKYGWNERPWTWSDFEYFCSRDRITFGFQNELPLDENGGMPFGLFVDGDRPGERIIAILPNMDERFTLEVAFHELAHAWLHSNPPLYAWNSDSVLLKCPPAEAREEQANIISRVALMPQAELLAINEDRRKWLVPRAESTCGMIIPKKFSALDNQKNALVCDTYGQWPGGPCLWEDQRDRTEIFEKYGL
jgi:hypothetical protein